MAIMEFIRTLYEKEAAGKSGINESILRVQVLRIRRKLQALVEEE